MKKYYIKTEGGKHVGPLTPEIITEKVADGTLGSQTLVTEAIGDIRQRLDSTTEWKSIGELLSENKQLATSSPVLSQILELYNAEALQRIDDPELALEIADSSDIENNPSDEKDTFLRDLLISILGGAFLALISWLLLTAAYLRGIIPQSVYGMTLIVPAIVFFLFIFRR